MGATAEELRLDIEAKRAELGDDLEALGRHVAPGQVAQRKGAEYAAKLRDGLAALKQSVGGDGPEPADDRGVAPGTAPSTASIAQNPLAMAGIAVVLGYLVGNIRGRRRARRR